MREVQKKYEKKPEFRERFFCVNLKLHKEHDADVVARLKEVPQKNTYIKQLIRDDISRKGT